MLFPHFYSSVILFHMHLFEDQVLEICINATNEEKKVDGVPIMLIKVYSLILFF